MIEQIFSNENDEAIYFQHPLTDIFLDLCLQSKTVICSRTAPNIKSFVVRTVKKRFKDIITASVGDGANDVPMLKEANIGKITH